MLKIENVIRDIECLSFEEKNYIYKKLKKEILKDIDISIILKKYKGIATNLWNVDAQKYVKQLREHDRI